MSKQPSEMMIDNNNAGVCRLITASGQEDVGMLRHGEKRRMMGRILVAFSALFFAFLFTAVQQASAVTETFTTSGTWICPAGVSSVTVEVWGSGGGGGGDNSKSSGTAGAGGGGGAYAKLNTYAVTPSTGYAYTIGTAGAAGAAGVAGGAGGDTFFVNTSTVMAIGGSGGQPDGGAAGVGGASASSVGDVKYSGGNGFSAAATASGGGGGASGGTAAIGTTATSATGAGAVAGGGPGGDGGAANAAGTSPVSGPGGGGGGGGDRTGAGMLGGAGFDGQVSITYTSLPTVQWTAATQASVGESGTLTVTAQLSATSASIVTVPFTVTGTATGGTDYTITASSITINPGSTTGTETITIVGDTRDELNETVVLTMETPTNAVLGATTVHTATITDDDPTPTVTFTTASQSSVGETGSMTITAQLSAASNLPVEVPFTVNASSTATAATDYTISVSPLTINPGATTATITITIVPDTLDEANETVVVNMGTLTNATQGATIAHTATITDDDPTPTVQWTTANQASANEVNGTTMIVTAQLSAVSGRDVSVPFTVTGTATGSGIDYTITPVPSIAINAGATTGTATITIVGDALSEGNETVILTIGTPTNATASGTTVHSATITDDDGPVCTQNPMTISVTPATQNVRAGFAIPYTVMVTNNDSVECANLTVNLLSADTGDTADFDPSSLSAASIANLAPQTSGNVTLTVTAKVTGIEGRILTSTVTASAAGHTNQIDTAISTIMNYNPMIHSSKSTNSTKWAANGGWGIVGGKYGEFTCGTCHVKGTGNIKRVKTSIETPDIDPWVGSNTQAVAVTLSATTGANSYGDDGRATLTSSNMVCEVCHSATTFHRYNSSTGVTDFNHMDGNLGDCISCHAHNKGFDASCTTCHGYPPVDAGTLVIVTSRPTGSTTAGAHNTHVATFSISCALCHYNSAGSGATHNVNGQVSLGFVNLPTGTGGVSSGSYNGQATVTYNLTDAGTTVSSGGTKTCTNYCHGSTIGAAGAVWDNPLTGECGDCHGAAVATPPTRVNHPRHVGTAAGQLGLTCDMCHGFLYSGGSAPIDHLSGSVIYDVSGLTGNTPTYRGFSIAQQTGALAPSGTYGNCGNVYCHSNVQSVNGTAAASVYATPTWGAASVACDSCHGQAAHTNGQPSSGSHEIHVTTRGYACSACHTGAGDETALHANSVINVSIPATYGATAAYTQPAQAPGSGGYGTCSNVTCHNGKITLAWGNTTGGCILCHTVDGTNSATVANPVSGLHSNTVASVQDHDSTITGGCEACHVKASITGHWNGVASATADYTKAAVGITAAMYTDAGGILATRGTCMGTSDLTSCHTDKGNWRRQWSTDADTDIVAGSKLPGQAVCNVCHGQYSTLTNSDGWSEGTAHYRSSDLADPTTENKGIIHADAGDECEDCHGYDSVAVHNSNNKIDFSDLGNPGGYAVTLNAAPTPDVWYCATCHTAQNTQVATLTASHTFLDSLAFPNATNPINHVTGTSIPQGSCFGCHGDGVSKYWPQNVGNVRGSTTTADYNNAGKHQIHIDALAARLSILLPGDDTQQKTMCGYCHTVADGDHMTTGVTELAEVFTGGGKSLWNGADADAAFNTTSYNCTTTDCHNSKDTTTTYSWYTASTSTCTMCHTVGGTNTATTAHPSSGIHDAARITGKLHDDAFTYNNGLGNGNCVTCHTATPTTGTNQHISGVNDYSIGAIDAVDPKVNLAATVGFVDAVVPTCAPTLANGCHIEQWNAVTDHTWTHQWHESAGLNTGAECRGCHGTFTQNWQAGVSPNHTTDYDLNNGAEVRLNHDHGAGTETEYNQCISCHVYNDALYAATLGWNPTAANKHGNGSIEMITDMGYATASNTCATTCHVTPEVGSHAMTPDSGWTVANLVGPALTCSSCHSGYTTHIDADGAGATYTSGNCTDCHAKHADATAAGANVIYVPTVYGANIAIPTMNANYSSHGYKIRLGGNATIGACNTKSTEAEWCWACHDAQTPTKISEWRANNKAKTGSKAYDYGDLYTDVTSIPGTVTSNWTTGYWRSGKGLNSTLTTNPYWYKRGKIRSTHSANYDAAAATPAATEGTNWKAGLVATVAAGFSTAYNWGETLDAVANIRCSYCHDVHGTHNNGTTDVVGTPDAPYLRGTWTGNAYNEDGAPRYGMANFTNQSVTASTVFNYAFVPRASASPTNPGITGLMVGGYWIDQNSNNPNGTLPADSAATRLAKADASSGLCEMCHGANKNGVWTQAAIGGLDLKTGEALWVSGLNGHANSVIGAPGAASTAANIFNRTKRNGSAGPVSLNAQVNQVAVDMGLQNMTSGYGLSYRSASGGTSGYGWIPRVGQSTETAVTGTRAYAYEYFAWNTTLNANTGRTSTYATNTMSLDVSNPTPVATETAHNSQTNYHTFTCSKCHNPHASRLPKLMITNCLDTNHNTWEDKSTFTGTVIPAGVWALTRHSQWASAQNCHRLDARATNSTSVTTLGTGWNKVTPWQEDTTPNGTLTGDITTQTAY